MVLFRNSYIILKRNRLQSPWLNFIYVPLLMHSAYVIMNIPQSTLFVCLGRSFLITIFRRVEVFGRMLMMVVRTGHLVTIITRISGVFPGKGCFNIM